MAVRGEEARWALRYGRKKMREDASSRGRSRRRGGGESNREIRLRVLVGIGDYMKGRE